MAEAAEDTEINKESSKTENEDDFGGPLFSPPLYRQRYMTVLKILEDRNVRTVIDVGCAECKFLPMLRRLPHMEEVVGVDIDRNLLESVKFRSKPLVSEYLEVRYSPLRLRLFEGDISQPDSRLVGFDAVTFIEVIEHLVDDVLAALPRVLFGHMQPGIVVMTTPNQEYNVVFKDFTGMRHPDHKFEWTRHQFQEWCNKVCSDYGYSVQYGGVGDPPAERPGVGPCSQMAVFTRESFNCVLPDSLQVPSHEKPYSLVNEVLVPCREQLDSEAALRQEAEYHVRRLAFSNFSDQGDNVDQDGDDEGDGYVCRVKLEAVLNARSVKALCSDIGILREVLVAAGYQISKDGLQVLVPEEYSSTDEEDYSDKAGSDGEEVSMDADPHQEKSEPVISNTHNTEEERWSDDDDAHSSHQQSVIPYWEMWANAEDTSCEEAHKPVRTAGGQGECVNGLWTGGMDVLTNWTPEDSGLDPDMVYVPSILHAPSISQPIRTNPGCVSKAVYQRPYLARASGNHSTSSPFPMELGQFDDADESDIPHTTDSIKKSSLGSLKLERLAIT